MKKGLAWAWLVVVFLTIFVGIPIMTGRPFVGLKVLGVIAGIAVFVGLLYWSLDNVLSENWKDM